jgi:hypothetical protein
MLIIQEPKKVALWNKWHFEEKKTESVQHVKNSVRIFVEKIYKMVCLEGSGVPVLYIGRTVRKGLIRSYILLSKYLNRCVLLGFSCETDDNWALLSYYAASSGNLYPTLRDNQSCLFNSWTLVMEPIGCPEKLVRNYHYWLRNDSEERSSYFNCFLYSAFGK